MARGVGVGGGEQRGELVVNLSPDYSEAFLRVRRDQRDDFLEDEISDGGYAVLNAVLVFQSEHG
jgi:hypothetical protein